MNEVYKFEFKYSISKEKLEEQMAFAIVTAECVFGQAKVRLHAGYLIAKNKVAIDVEGEIGEHIAESFTSLVIRHFGEESFTVEKIKKEKTHESNSRI